MVTTGVGSGTMCFSTGLELGEYQVPISPERFLTLIIIQWAYTAVL